jgi:GT2 family glycosyltransferase
MGRDPSFKQGLITGNLNPIYQTNWVIGAAILLRVDVIKKVGMLDPHYFMYGEENDLCRRIRFHGWKIAYVRDAIVYHHGGFLSEDKQRERLIWQLRSTMIYYLKDPFCLSARGFWRSLRTALSAKRITKGELSLYEVIRCWIEVVLMSRSLLKRRYLEMFSPQDLPELKRIF